MELSKISVIVSWPDSFDFPIFRKNLSKLQEQVGQVMVCFNHHGNHSLRDFLTKFMPEVKFLYVENSNYPGDWRNKSTKYMISQANNEYVLSMEQDFMISDYSHFFNTIKKSKKDIVMFQENNERGSRFHPAFLLCKKEYLDGPEIDFSVMGQGIDHFALATKKLKNHDYISLQDLGLKEKEDWYHMRGLTDNQFAPKPYYALDEFYTYNIRCLNSGVDMSKYWYNLMCKWNLEAPKEVKYQDWMVKFL